LESRKLVWVAEVEVLTGVELDQGMCVVAIVDGDKDEVGKGMRLGIIVFGNDCCCLERDY
jgi:hypothetical protein